MDNNVKWVATLASCALVGAAGYIAMKQNPKMANEVKKAAKNAGKKVNEIKNKITDKAAEMKG